MNICQATKHDPAEVEIASDSPDGPYYLSRAAAERLQGLCLRPIEWYNLAVIHGPFEYWLHDDFYDQDGAACQPESEVVDELLYPAPELHEVADNIDSLIDFAQTGWWLDDDVVLALKHIDPMQLQDAIIRRHKNTKNPFFHDRYYAIAGSVLKNRAREWIRQQLEAASWKDCIGILTVARDCLPVHEAFTRTRVALQDAPKSALINHILSLAEFRDPSSLDWIEEHICEPITSQWGDLAASSRIDWDRVAKWLDMGRPLSLVALDALVACDCPRPNQSILMQGIAPKLINPPRRDDVKAALCRYMSGDDVPRVRKAIGYIIERWDSIKD